MTRIFVVAGVGFLAGCAASSTGTKPDAAGQPDVGGANDDAAGGAGGAGGAAAGAGGAGGGGGGAVALDGGDGTSDGPAPRDGGGGAAGGAPGPTYVYVSGSDPLISVLTLDLQTGALTPRSTTTARATAADRGNPAYLGFSPDKRFVYAALDSDPGRAVGFSINPATGALTRLNAQDSTGANPISIAVDPSQKWLVVPNFIGHNINVYPLAADGAIGAATPNVIMESGTVHQAVFSRDGKYLFVPSTWGNLYLYRFDAATGIITRNTPARIPNGGNPRHIAFHPSNKWAYVINEGGATMTSFRYNEATGVLSDGQDVPTVPQGEREVSAAHVVVHPNGRFVYGSNRDYNSIVIFKTETDEGGRLTLVKHEKAGNVFRYPRGFAVDPTGQWLIVANRDTDALLIFRIDAATGLISPVGQPVTVPNAPYFVEILTLP